MTDPVLMVSVAQLAPADREGWLTKQGGAIKTWRRRWFVLKGKKLYYFKNKTDVEATGLIEFEPDSFVKDERDKDKKKKFMFSLGTSKRVYYIYAEVESDMKQWIESIRRAFGGEGGSATRVDQSATKPAGVVEQPKPQNGTPEKPASSTGPRSRISNAKSVIPFLRDEDSKVLEFWQIWSESIPPQSDLQSGTSIEFHVATSIDMQKLTWRTAGPQNIFIQKMVDFFWNVGAPETEIDRLNDVGALINPVKIGSWIDMSDKGGMDGGWYFPVDIPLKLAIEASDIGEPTRKLAEWAESNDVLNCYSVGRDMGAAPPRQTEIRLKLPGPDFSTQLNLAIDAFKSFGFPQLPGPALDILRQGSSEMGGLCLSVITSSEGFVRLGLLVPKPSREVVNQLCDYGQANKERITKFEQSLGGVGPAYVEYQYLQKGFGYTVYKEGFDIVFHYFVGEDHSEIKKLASVSRHAMVKISNEHITHYIIHTMFKQILASIVILALVASSVASPLSKAKVGKKGEGCAVCVDAMGQAINDLLNIIVNGGVIGGCSGLCGLLPNSIENMVCSLACDYFGIEEFVKLVQEEDPDPIYFCQVARACPQNAGAAASINVVSVTPASAPQGTTFTISAVYNVTSVVNVGQVGLNVIDPAGNVVGGAELILYEAPGVYPVQFSLQAQPSEQEPFQAGSYEVQIAVCTGTCGSIHKGASILAEANTNFTITGQTAKKLIF
ncbi:pleckstrin domain-containing protein [Cavenderia fasciculata]|uniref:Pleckstrin domain-containing protein n=1 Tax=Cavenderia fasciculata TaxID=261658 RepID=F4PZZ1_CACFS|nr:pleckstrin domain-containing protein [Cavenderia fasciculata]EGG18905.1 pleckstrin domain-containing protein [Cavenderia fasciculata]|eukprot:XP_004357367.1 pleckstrin domain-containing protein [Cavenderia fasciculata]